MNTYTTNVCKFYCLNNIKPNYHYAHHYSYDFKRKSHIHYLSCYHDGSENLLHREDGAAIERIHGDKEWYYNGLRHRIDGPAMDTNGFKHWYYYGDYIMCDSQEKFEKILKMKAFL